MNAAPAGTGSLSARQQAIVPIAAFAASGDIARLSAALQRGLDAGLGVNELKELLVQVYAYAGFPRSLNALGELMKVLEARRQRGLRDREGPLPSRPVPRGDALLAAGTANQTKLSGGPVRGRCSTSPRPSASSSRPICSATCSSATTSTGKAANSPPSACCRRSRASSRNSRPTCASR